MAVTSTSIPEPVCPVIIECNGYSERKSNKKEGNPCYYSRPLYTHLGGYKMRLNIYLNGTGSGKGTHLSVFGTLIRGENDDHLNWPFKGTIDVTLLNQLEDKGHHCNVIWDVHDSVPDEAKSKPSTADRKSWGHPGSMEMLFMYVCAEDCQINILLCDSHYWILVVYTLIYPDGTIIWECLSQP